MIVNRSSSHFRDGPVQPGATPRRRAYYANLIKKVAAFRGNAATFMGRWRGCNAAPRRAYDERAFACDQGYKPRISRAIKMRVHATINAAVRTETFCSLATC